jgi:hypothetical protein
VQVPLYGNPGSFDGGVSSGARRGWQEERVKGTGAAGLACSLVAVVELLGHLPSCEGGRASAGHHNHHTGGIAGHIAACWRHHPPREGPCGTTCLRPAGVRDDERPVLSRPTTGGGGGGTMSFSLTPFSLT